jgi:hypothetical protein
MSLVADMWSHGERLPFWLRRAETLGHRMTAVAGTQSDRWVCAVCGETAVYPGAWGLPENALVNRCRVTS